MTIRMLEVLAQITRSDINNVPQGDLSNASVQNILKIVFGIAGSIAVIMMTIAGLKYVLARGNPQETAAAKNTIIYTAIGLVAVILAFSIVTFVVGRV